MKNTFFFLLSVLVGIGTLAWSQGSISDSKYLLNIEQKACRVPKLLETISNKTGFQIKATPDFDNVVVVARFENVPLSEVLNRLASITAGEWRMEGEKWVLHRSVTKQQAEQAEEFALKLKLIQKAQQKLKERLKKPLKEDDLKRFLKAAYPADPQEVSPTEITPWQEMQMFVPSERASLQAVCEINPSVIASIPHGERVVFSSKPTALQRALPGSILARYEQLRAQNDLYRKLEIEQLKLNPRYSEVDLHHNYPEAEPKDPAALAMLIIEPVAYSTTADINVQLVFYSQRLEEVLRASCYLAWPSFARLGEKDPEIIHAFPEPVEQLLKVSNETKLLSLKRRYSMADSKQPISKEIEENFKKKLLSPEEFEPLGLFGADLLIPCSKFKKLNLLACLPDRSALALDALGAIDSILPAPYLDLFRLNGMKVEEKDNWLIIRSEVPYTDRQKTEKRHQLGVLFKKATSNDGLSLEDLAQHALQTPEQAEYFLSESFLTALGCGATLLSSNDSRTLRFYGSLNLMQKQELNKGNPIDLRTLNAIQKYWLSRAIYGGKQQGPGLMVNKYREEQQELSPPTSQQDLAPNSMEWTTLNNEPTWVLPRGIPSLGELKFELSTEEILMVTATNLYGKQEIAMNSASYCWYVLGRKRPDLVPGYEQDDTQYSGFRLGKTNSVSIRFLFPGSIESQGFLYHSQPNAGTKSGPFEKLPPEFLKAFEKTLKEVEQQAKDQKKQEASEPTHQPEKKQEPPS